MISLRTVTLALLVATPLASQSTTWRVGSGVGASFSQIQAAVDAAAPGDTILVDPGVYAAVQVSKGVRILCTDASVQSIGQSPPLTVSNLPANQTLVVRGLATLIGHGGTHVEFVIADCRGAVVVEDCALIFGIEIQRSDRVSLRDVRVGTGAIECTDSTVDLHDCSANGAQGFVFQIGLVCRRSDVIATGCRFSGGASSIVPGGPYPAVLLDGGSLIVVGPTHLAAGLGQPTPGSRTPAIGTISGSLTIDTAATLVPAVGSPAVAGPGVASIRALGLLRATVDPASVLLVVMEASGAQAAVVLAGAPRGVPLPTPFGFPLWTTPAPLVIAMTPDAQGRGVRAFSVAGFPMSVPLVFQGAFLRANRVELTNPLTRTMH